jgi:hypothetical protein
MRNASLVLTATALLIVTVPTFAQQMNPNGGASIWVDEIAPTKAIQAAGNYMLDNAVVDDDNFVAGTWSYRVNGHSETQSFVKDPKSTSTIWLPINTHVTAICNRIVYGYSSNGLTTPLPFTWTALSGVVYGKTTDRIMQSVSQTGLGTGATLTGFAFTYTEGNSKAIPVPGGMGTGISINEAGDIAGTSLVNGVHHAFLYSATSKTSTDLGAQFPSGTETISAGITGDDTVVGTAKFPANIGTSDVVFVQYPGHPGAVLLANPGAATAVAVNQSEMVLCNVMLSGTIQPFLWQRPNQSPINLAATFSTSGIALGRSTGMNDYNTIVGEGQDTKGRKVVYTVYGLTGSN